MTLTIGKNGECPWFVNNIEEYKKINSFEKAIYSLDLLTKLQEQTESNKILNENNYLIIPFESFVLDSESWVNKLCDFLKIDNERELRNYLPKI